MKEIVEYTDYRKFIQDYYDERKRTSAFTWRDFARDAGFSSAVYLKYVCEGKKNLSINAAGSVAAAMGLVGFEQTYFVLMVSYAHAKGDEAKRAAFEDRCALARAHKVHVLGNEEFDYFKSWKNPVLRELAPHMLGAKPLEIAHVCKQKISATEVSETLDFLVKPLEEGQERKLQPDGQVAFDGARGCGARGGSQYATPDGRVCGEGFGLAAFGTRHVGRDHGNYASGLRTDPQGNCGFPPPRCGYCQRR